MGTSSEQGLPELQLGADADVSLAEMAARSNSANERPPSAVPVGQSPASNKRPQDAAEDRVHKKARSAEQENFKRWEVISVRNLLTDPVNRGGTFLQTEHVHNLLGQILDVGYDPQKAEGAIAVEIGDSSEIVRYNARMVQGEPLLAPVLGEDNSPLDTPLYTLLAGNHLLAILRAFVYKAKTTDANKKKGVTDDEVRLDLDKLKIKDPEFAEACEKGMRVKILDKRIRSDPDAMLAIQASCNIDLSMPEHEVQLLLDAQRLIATQGMELGEAKQRLCKQYSHFGSPMVDAALQVAQQWGTGPFLQDIADFHSTVIRAAERRCSPNFWLAISQVPAGCGWAAVAMVKCNYLSPPQRIIAGVCNGWGAPEVNSARHRDNRSKLVELNSACLSFRSQHGHLMTGANAESRALGIRALGRADSVTCRVVLKGLGTFALAEKTETEKLIIKSVDQAQRVALHFLWLHLGRPSQWTAPEISDVERDASEKQDSKSSNVKSAQSSKEQGLAPVYDAAGTLVNWKQVLQAKGVEKGAVVKLRHECPCGKGTLPAESRGTVQELSDTEILVHFQGIGAHQWSVATFPVEEIDVVQLGGRQKTEIVAEWHGEAVQDSMQFCRQQAIALVTVGLGVFAKSVIPQVHCLTNMDQFFKVVEAPTRRVELLQDMKHQATNESQLILLPMTHQCRPVPQGSASVLETGVMLAGTGMTEAPQIMGLEETRYKKDDAVKNRQPVPFWYVRRVSSQEKKGEANMELASVTFAGALSAALPKGSPLTMGLDFKLPAMVLTKDVAKGEELVCWWPVPEPSQKAKQAAPAAS